MVKYISTRGQAPALDFEEVVLAGLAADGGLYVPDRIPQLSLSQIAGMKKLSYVELAYSIMEPFTGGMMEKADLKRIIEESYTQFDHPKIAPLTALGKNEYMLELFHGPTLAFKDFALQILGRLLEHILKKRGQKAVVLGATSGDTGSAAIAGCRGRGHMDIFILHPHERVSEVQRRQMTTVLDHNVHNIAVEGTFDDCQNLVKILFGDADFRNQHHLVAVNSINWARIMAQVVYYFYAALQLGAPEKAIRFCVPTGNFGDIYAGYIAKRMGLPVEKLIIATNRNDILHRCAHTGIYSMEGVVPTLSPSMDIQISSNFERLLFDLHDRNPGEISRLMEELRSQKKMTLSPAVLARLQAEFTSERADDAATLATIKTVYEENNIIIDPHTAVGVTAARAAKPGNTSMVILSTAHPAKFPDAVEKAIAKRPPLPASMVDLFKMEERFDVMNNNPAILKTYIEKNKL